MQLKITTNAAEIASDYRKADVEFISDLETGFAQASQNIAESFKRNQLSGRKSDDTGLNVKRDVLRQSIKGSGMRDGMTIVGMVTNSMATYWEYHQDGTLKLPKRLFFYEEFETTGEKAYTSVVEMAMEKLAA